MIYAKKQNKQRRHKPFVERNLCFLDWNGSKSSWLKDLTGEFYVARVPYLPLSPQYSRSPHFKSALLSAIPTSIYDETVVDPVHLGDIDNPSKVNENAPKHRIRPLIKDSYFKVIEAAGSKHGLARESQKCSNQALFTDPTRKLLASSMARRSDG